MIRDRDTFLAFMQRFLDKIKDYVIDKFITEDDIIRYINEHNIDQESHIDIRNSITALQGAFIYRGNINNTTEDIRDNTSLLTTKIQALLGNNHPLIGDVLIDNELVEWYYNGSIWNEYGQGEIGLATGSADGLMSKDLWTKLNNTPTSFAPTNAQKNVQSDWNSTNTQSDSYIHNKPVLYTKQNWIDDFISTGKTIKNEAIWSFNQGFNSEVNVVYEANSSDDTRTAKIMLGRRDRVYSKWWIEAASTGTWGDNPNLYFKNSTTGAQSPVTRVTFAQNGNVGIGTDTPSYLLDVNGTLRSKGYIIEGDDAFLEMRTSTVTATPLTRRLTIFAGRYNTDFHSWKIYTESTSAWGNTPELTFEMIGSTEASPEKIMTLSQSPKRVTITPSLYVEKNIHISDGNLRVKGTDIREVLLDLVSRVEALENK